jgi:hypothetical protein
MASQAQIDQDVAQLESVNRERAAIRSQVVSTLNQITGADLPEDRNAWTAWLDNQLGYARPPKQSALAFKPTLVQNSAAYMPRFDGAASKPLQVVSHSCFAAGTRVITLEGSRAIETLEVGDRVLTENARDGELRYQPVLSVLRNPPSPTFAVRVSGDTIVTSPFHRFWVSQRGWVMARDLKGGEKLRTVEGSKKIHSVEAGEVQPVYNLTVAVDHDFFVGSIGALVHDITLPDTRQVPFDASPELASVSSRR